MSEHVAWTDGGVRLSARWHDDGERVVVNVWRSAARGWVGTGALCGSRGQVLDWLGDGKWPDAAPFVSRLRGWLDRTGPVDSNVA